MNRHTNLPRLLAIMVTMTSIFVMSGKISYKTEFVPAQNNKEVFRLDTGKDNRQVTDTKKPIRLRERNIDINDEQDPDQSIYTCTLHLSFDNTRYEFITAFGVSPTELYYSYGINETDNERVFEVPAGVYDACFIWDDLQSGKYVVVVKENIDIYTDIELNVDVEEATEDLHFTVIKKDGEELIPYTMEYDENWQLQEVEKGNTDDSLLNLLTSVYNKKYNFPIFTTTYFSNGNILGNELVPPQSIDSYNTIRINPLSDNYIVNHQEVYYDQGYLNVVCFEWKNGDFNELRNNPENFISNEIDFIQTPLVASSNPPADSGLYPLYVFNFMSYTMGGGLYMEGSDPAMCREVVCLTNEYVPDNYMISVWGTDYAIEEEDWINTYDVRSCAIGIRNGEFRYSSVYNSSYTNNPDGVENRLLDNPFAFSAEDNLITLGDNTPFMKFTAYNGNFISSLSNGQKGENRKPDLIRTSAILKNGGNVVAEYPNVPRTIILPEDTHSDSWTLETTNTNINTGGLDGENRAILNFRTSEDNIQPLMVIQAIQLRDNQDKVTCNFNKAEDGRICVAGGLFDLHSDEETFTMWYSCSDIIPSVEISYSIHGANEWKSLDTTYDPQKFCMPGLGHYFEASTEGIDGRGWYDLKITLKNSSGDENSQELKPAFLIENTSGTDRLSDQHAIHISDGYIDAPADARIFGIDGREHGRMTLPQGIYIVVSEDGVHKIYVK